MLEDIPGGGNSRCESTGSTGSSESLSSWCNWSLERKRELGEPGTAGRSMDSDGGRLETPGGGPWVVS